MCGGVITRIGKEPRLILSSFTSQIFPREHSCDGVHKAEKHEVAALLTTASVILEHKIST